MIRFIVYLFETGLCLSLLYLAYWLFLRKETYFNFNRIFLVGSIVLALTVPLIHLNLIIPLGSSLEDTAFGIVKFRNYYEELILMSDADFGSEPGSRHRVAGNIGSGYGGVEQGIIPGSGNNRIDGDLSRLRDTYQGVNGGIASAKDRNRFSASGIIILIYIIGVLYFLSRFLYLVIRLYLLALRNGVTRQEGFRMVEIEEDISPFSFFRFLFINKRTFDESEMQNVLEHEKAHIRQKHSLDHLFAHGLAVFQWFNPFAWQISSALKTTHEYIADRKVLDHGFEIFDYQSLLLKQVIGYHSVELVNNFNLKPIKNRIAMMTKTRSGIPARLKAMLVIPFAIIIFLLFAEFTVKGPGNSFLDMNSVVAGKTIAPDIKGLWVKQDKDDFSKLLYFTDDMISYMDGDNVNEYYWRIEKEELILSQGKGKGGVHLKTEIKGEILTIWWNDLKGSHYRKSDADNSMDYFLEDQGMKIDLPYISQFRLMEKQSLVYKIFLGYAKDGSVALSFNGNAMDIGDLEGLVEKERSKRSKMDIGKLTALFYVDREMPMKERMKVQEELRRINSLKIADAGYPEENQSISPIIWHTVALPRMLPPMDAKLMEKEDIEKMGMKLFIIDLSARNTSPLEIDQNLTRFIQENDGGKYVFSMEYDQEIPYGQYIESVDLVFKVVYSFREKLALKKYSIPYADLGTDRQKEIRRAYPMVLSEAWND